MKTKFIDRVEKYDGSQLVSLRAYLKHKILGDSMIAWVGGCDIPFEHMVDGEDLNERAVIRGDRMVHFILEKFDGTLLAAVSLQRLLASTVRDYLQDKTDLKLVRKGDDIFAGDRKLSISIATVSPVSALIHFAVNVNNKKTPVKTLALQDLDVDPKKFATDILKKFSREVESIDEATQKVRWVK